jgi:hypothetical protein
MINQITDVSLGDRMLALTWRPGGVSRNDLCLTFIELVRT